MEKAAAQATLSASGLKEFLELHLRLSLSVQLVIKYVSEEMVNGGPDEWFMPDLVKLICAMLHVQNHPVVRKEGMRAVLLWLRDSRLEAGIFRDLLGESVRLQPFEEDGNLPSGIRQTPADTVAGSSRVSLPLVPWPPNYTPLQSSKQAMRDLLLLMTFEMDPNTSKTAIAQVYQYFKESYVVPYYQPHQNPHHCPDSLQIILVEFYALWTVQFLPDGFKTTAIPALCFMLSEHLLSTNEELQLVMAVLKEAHLLPFQHAASIKTAMAVVRQWVFAGRDRRPDFLNRSRAFSNEQEEQYYSLFLQMTASIFDDRSIIGLQQEQIALYREAMLFLRQFTLQPACQASSQLREQLINILLTIGGVLFGSPNKYSRIVTPGVAEDFAGFYGETLFVSVIRLANDSAAQWKSITSTCRSLTRWPLFANSFGDQVIRLTELLIDSIVMNRENPRPSTPRQQSQSMSLESNSGRASPRPADFASWTITDVGLGRVVHLWRNLLTVFGDMTRVEVVDVHYSLVKAFVAITDRLMAVREQQGSTDASPPVFEVFEQLCQAAKNLQDDAGRQAAIACLALLVSSNKLAIAVEPERSLRVVELVLLALSGDRPQDHHVALEAANLLVNSNSFGFELLFDSLIPIISLPTCQPFLVAVNLLGSMVTLKEYDEKAWAILKSFYATYRHDMLVLDALLPSITCACCFHLSQSPSIIGLEAVNLLLDSITPFDMKIPTASIHSVDTLIVWLHDHKDTVDDSLLSLIMLRMTAAVRATCLSVTAGNPKAAIQDQIGGLLMSLLARFAGCLPSAWLSEHEDGRKQLLECLQESLANPLQLQSSQLVQAAERLDAQIRYSVNNRLSDPIIDCEHHQGVHFVWSESLYSLFPHKQDHNKAILVVRSVAGHSQWEIGRGGFSDCEEGLQEVQFPCQIKQKLESYSEYAGPWPADDDNNEDDLSDGKLPHFQPDTDMLGKLIAQLHGHHDEVYNDTDDSDNMVGTLCRKRFAQELAIAEKCDTLTDPSCKHSPQPTTNAFFGRSTPNYQLPRMWLAALGLLSKDTFISRLIEPLVPSNALSADLLALDALPNRLLVKAALIYQPAGHELESQVFGSIPTVSTNYKAFCQSLGWPVSLLQHHAINAYSGGLDHPDTQDGQMLYYGDSQVEIAWIESARLAGEGVDEKRRSLGSHLVHVVWSEHVKEWRSASVRGAVEIVVSMQNKSKRFCRVKVSAPAGVDFGPLKPGVSVQPLSVIGCLVRATVVSAHFACLAHLSRQPHLHPYPCVCV